MSSQNNALKVAVPRVKAKVVRITASSTKAAASLRLELSSLSNKELRVRAKAHGATVEQLEEVSDQEDPKFALVSLLLELEAASESAAADTAAAAEVADGVAAHAPPRPTQTNTGQDDHICAQLVKQDHVDRLNREFMKMESANKVRSNADGSNQPAIKQLEMQEADIMLLRTREKAATKAAADATNRCAKMQRDILLLHSREEAATKVAADANNRCTEMQRDLERAEITAQHVVRLQKAIRELRNGLQANPTLPIQVVCRTLEMLEVVSLASSNSHDAEQSQLSRLSSSAKSETMVQLASLAGADREHDVLDALPREIGGTAGGIRLAISAIDDSENLATQTIGCKLLFAFSREADLKPALVGMGGIVSIKRALDMQIVAPAATCDNGHDESHKMTELATWACRAVCNISSFAGMSTEIASAGMIPTIASIIHSHARCQYQVVLEACRLLRRLAYNNVVNKGIIASQGCIIPLVQTLEQYHDNVVFCLEVVELLVDKYFDHGGAASLAFNDSENRRQIAKTNCMSVIEAVLEEHGGAALAFREHAVWLLRTISADPSSPHQNALTLATELPAEFKTKMESSLLDKTVEGCLTATPHTVRFESSTFGHLSSRVCSDLTTSVIEIPWHDITEVKAVGGGIGLGFVKSFKLKLSLSKGGSLNTNQVAFSFGSARSVRDAAMDYMTPYFLQSR